MMIFTKSRFHRLREAFNDALNAAKEKSGRSTLRQVALNAAKEKTGPSTLRQVAMNAAKEKPGPATLRRIAIATGSFVGLTAASAGISSLRRREEARGDS
jgi:hypothetical protein